MHILIIEDDKDLCFMMEHALHKNSFTTTFCHNGEDALFYALKQTYDLIILDRMLPSKDGLTLIKEIRSNHVATPVIMVTAMGSLDNRVEGLNNGADDYLVKPFAMEELIARIGALIRRPSTIVHNDILTFSNIKLNLTENKLYSDTTSCSISNREKDLLAFLIRNKDQIVTRDMLLTRIWGADSFVMDSNLDNFICFLRKRLRSVQSCATVKTVRGVGYKLEA